MSEDKRVFISFSNGGPIANTASIVTQVFTSPLNDSVIIVSDKNTETEELRRKATEGISLKFQDVKSIVGRLELSDKPSSKIIGLPSVFKIVVIAAITITVLAGGAEIILASLWTNPTPNQQTAFTAMDTVLKAGVGAIIGLLGGKNLT